MNKPYVRPFDRTWFLKRPSYAIFMLRELSSVFVALYVLELLCLAVKIKEGPEAMAAFFSAMASPGWIIFHTIALAFSLLHTVTWFNATHQALAVRIGEEKVPNVLVDGANYVAWVVVSVVLGWVLLS